MLTQKEAWLEIAADFDAGRLIEGGWFTVSRNGSLGICSAIGTLSFSRKLSLDDSQAMSAAIDALLNYEADDDRGYKWPLTVGGAQQRAEFCREQARKLSEGENQNGKA